MILTRMDWKFLILPKLLMTNKEASAKQEKLVADYMGWHVVSGSGARPFKPGDVNNEHYLAECKTHVNEQTNIVFYKKHWDKIAIESSSVHKRPVLITDNGTQNSSHTWVAIHWKTLPENCHIILGLNNTSRSENTITFNAYEAAMNYKQGYQDSDINYFIEKFGKDELAIMPLSEFKKFYQDQYEC